MNNKVFGFSLFVLFACFAAMIAADELIKNEITPYGIVSFEFIHTIANVQAALNMWGTTGQAAVGFSLGIDYLFILAYSVVAIFGLKMTAQKVDHYSSALAKIILFMAAIFPLVALSDAIENFSLLRLLFGSENEVWVLVAYYSASIKFAVAALCLLCILLGQIYAFAKR